MSENKKIPEIPDFLSNDKEQGFLCFLHFFNFFQTYLLQKGIIPLEKLFAIKPKNPI
jgi:hypothetical protein